MTGESDEEILNQVSRIRLMVGEVECKGEERRRVSVVKSLDILGIGHVRKEDAPGGRICLGCRGRRGFGGESEAERGAVAGPAFGGDFAAVGLDDVFDDREPESGAALVP